MIRVMTNPKLCGLTGQAGSVSYKTPSIQLRQSLLRAFNKDTHNQELKDRIKRYIKMLSSAYGRTATNKLKAQFRKAIHNDDYIALYSISQTLEKKKILSFAPYQQGVLDSESIAWLKKLEGFFCASYNIEPGTKVWCEQITPLLDTNTSSLGATLQLIDDMQWDYYLANWPEYQEAVKHDINNINHHDPRLCLLARWAYGMSLTPY